MHTKESLSNIKSSNTIAHCFNTHGNRNKRTSMLPFLTLFLGYDTVRDVICGIIPIYNFLPPDHLPFLHHPAEDTELPAAFH